jgi:hypothetical protein
MEENQWFDDYAENEESQPVEEYNISATPNDFNILTINSFLESGSVRVPGFQRNYVWDMARASKLIESLILGLPVPQIFLYERERNQFLVIDGQQRLMSIYYFLQQRFPRTEKRAELRAIFDKHAKIPSDVVQDDSYFIDFALKLPSSISTKQNPFNDLSYDSLGHYKTSFELRTIRNVIVKQTSPTDDSSMFEIFNRLNTGGVNLKPQEIRSSMYHSPFYDLLSTVNTRDTWRKLIGLPAPDVHMKDIEFLLRAIALLANGSNYAPSMSRFLNEFSRKAITTPPEKNQFLKELFDAFLDACDNLPKGAFLRGTRFNVALFEAVFVGTCERAFKNKQLPFGTITKTRFSRLKNDKKFAKAMHEGTTKTENIATRLERAREILKPL